MQNARADTELVGAKDGVIYSKKKVIVVKSPSDASAKYEPVKYKSSKYDPYKYGSSKYKSYKYRSADEYGEPYRYKSARSGSYKSKPSIYNIYKTYVQKHDSDKNDGKTINIDIAHSSETSAENNNGYGGYNYNNHNQFLPNYYQPYSGFPSYYNNYEDYGS